MVKLWTKDWRRKFLPLASQCNTCHLTLLTSTKKNIRQLIIGNQLIKGRRGIISLKLMATQIYTTHTTYFRKFISHNEHQRWRIKLQKGERSFKITMKQNKEEVSVLWVLESWSKKPNGTNEDCPNRLPSIFSSNQFLVLGELIPTLFVKNSMTINPFNTKFPKF